MEDQAKVFIREQGIAFALAEQSVNGITGVHVMWSECMREIYQKGNSTLNDAYAQRSLRSLSAKRATTWRDS